ncbi:MAG: (d)CMP kinase [Rhizobiaceae bacterium]
MPQILIIAIDGPAASGKGTLGRRLAMELKLPHLDTGLTYRAVADAMIQSGDSLDDENAAVQAAKRVELGGLDRSRLSDHAIGNAASRVAAMPGVRRTLVELQRAFANTPPGAVLDGRDIGTVVCPNADVKLYVTASPEERARRRFEEMRSKGQQVELPDILTDIKARDARDTGRTDSPLKPAQDAHLLDTSQMDIEAAFQRALGIVKQVKNR